MSLNSQNNKYCCSRCGEGGYSIGLYAKLKHIDNKKAYRELLERECFSIDKSNIIISPVNELADIEKRDMVYRDFLNMLKLEPSHKKYLQSLGFLDTSIELQSYRSIPKNKINRRLIANKLKKKYDLAGIPGFYQDEDWVWNFAGPRGFFIPLFDEQNKIQALSIHLDKEYNGVTDMWFSSNGKINGTATKNWICKNNINSFTQTIVLTDDLLLGNFIKEVLNVPMIVFSNINNSYQILKVLDSTNIQNIIFTLRSFNNKNIDYVINRIFADLLPLGYNIECKYISEFKDIFKDNFLTVNTLNMTA